MMSAVSGRVANLTKQVLQKMRNNKYFKLFYNTVVTKSKKHPSISEPALPSRFEIGTRLPSYPTTPQEHKAFTGFVVLVFFLRHVSFFHNPTR